MNSTQWYVLGITGCSVAAILLMLGWTETVVKGITTSVAAVAGAAGFIGGIFLVHLHNSVIKALGATLLAAWLTLAVIMIAMFVIGTLSDTRRPIAVNTE